MRASIAAAAAVVVVSAFVSRPPFRLVATALVALIGLALPPTSSRYFLRRLPAVLGTVLVTTFVAFIAIELAPNSTRTTIGSLDLDLMRQYGRWLSGAFSGDLGRSSIGSEPVESVMGRSFPITLQLLVYSQVLALAVAVPLGAWSGWREGRRVDKLVSGLASAGAAVPVYVVGVVALTVLVMGSLQVGPVPLSVRVFPFGRYVNLGDGVVRHVMSMVLPSSVLALSLVPPYLRVLRADLITTTREDFLAAARSRGLTERRLLFGHTLRPSALSLVTLVGSLIGMSISNLLIIEELFSFPGLGDVTVLAVARRDTTTLLAVVASVTALVTVVNALTDALVVTLDPRIDADG